MTEKILYYCDPGSHWVEGENYNAVENICDECRRKKYRINHEITTNEIIIYYGIAILKSLFEPPHRRKRSKRRR
jgi:hypothetical protein